MLQYAPKFIVNLITYIFDARVRKYYSPVRAGVLYETWVAPKLAFLFGWIFWPVYKYFKFRKYIFIINNISSSPGHMSCELDWLLRDVGYRNETLMNKYIIIWPRSEVAHGAAKEYAEQTFPIYHVSTFLYLFALPFLMRYNQLVLDYGLSSKQLHKIKWINWLNLFKFNQLKSLSRNSLEVWQRWKEYYYLRSLTADKFPMRQGLVMDDELREFLGLKNDKNYVLLQIKTHVVNGTLLETDPNTYIPALRYLSDLGYVLVFMGREKIPDIFIEMGVINYSEWDKNSFERDLQIVRYAALGITSASGVANLFDVMGVPLVYCNHWSFIFPPPGKSTVYVPALIGDARTQKPWSFNKQITFVYDVGRTDFSGGRPSEIMVRNANAEEILEAAKEALALAEQFKPKSNIQEKFQALSEDPVLNRIEARISRYFVEKHQMFFE